MTEPIPPIEQQAPTRNAESTKETPQVGKSTHPSPVHLPRITIKYCTQCKWMLRAAYFAQELLQTFGTSLGEVSLVPTTGGVFTVTISHLSSSSNNDSAVSTEETLLWDRETNGGFPEVKQLKSLVRNVVDPSRDLGHVDRALGKTAKGADLTTTPSTGDTISGNTNSNPLQSNAEKTGVTKGDSQGDACQDCQ